MKMWKTGQIYMKSSVFCLACKHKNESEQNQIYLEMEVPPDGSKLSKYVEELINESSMVQYHCQDGCHGHFQAENRIQIKSCPLSDSEKINHD